MEIMTCNKAAQLRVAGTDNTAADRTLGDTIHASCSNSPFSRIEREFPDQGNIEENREEGPSGLLSNELSKPMIREVSNQIKDLMEVVKPWPQTRDKRERE